MIQLLYHHRLITETQCDPNMTVLHWLRRRQRQPGTKEGGASDDCGACTVALGRVVAGRIRYESANSCLLPISQLGESLESGNFCTASQVARIFCYS